MDTTEVGPFKKGPFRIAMAVGIPIVPIVIRNAELVAARNSTVINPGTVDVAVFPPISVQDWTVETLPEHIAEVRQLYLDTLANWPVRRTARGRSVRREEGGEKSQGSRPPKPPRRRRRPRRLQRKKARGQGGRRNQGQRRRLNVQGALKDGEAQQPDGRPSAPSRRSRRPEGGRDQTGRGYQRSPHRARLAGIGVHGLAGREGVGHGLGGPAARRAIPGRNSTYWSCRNAMRRRPR